MKKWLFLLLICLISTSAHATLIPGPDLLGVYFDGAAADVNEKQLPGFVYSYAYVVLTNPSVPHLDGFEFSYELVYYYDDFIGMGTGTGVIDDDWARTVNAIPVGGLNNGNADAIGAGEYVVDFASPLATPGNTVLVTWRMRCFADTGSFSLEFYLGPASVPSLPGGVPVVSADGQLYPLGYSNFCWPGNEPDRLVASFNVYCPLAVENTTFGAVKSLYR
jgi:hypothetical protein